MGVRAIGVWAQAAPPTDWFSAPAWLGLGFGALVCGLAYRLTRPVAADLDGLEAELARPAGGGRTLATWAAAWVAALPADGSDAPPAERRAAERQILGRHDGAFAVATAACPLAFLVGLAASAFDLRLAGALASVHPLPLAGLFAASALLFLEVARLRVRARRVGQAVVTALTAATESHRQARRAEAAEATTDRERMRAELDSLKRSLAERPVAVEQHRPRGRGGDEVPDDPMGPTTPSSATTDTASGPVIRRESGGFIDLP